MKKFPKYVLSLIPLLCLTSCEGNLSLFDLSFGDVYDKEGHYHLINGEKSNFHGHVFDKMVFAYEEMKTSSRDYVCRYYDYVCRCGYKMSYDMLSFEKKEEGVAITGYNAKETGYDLSGHLIYQERKIDKLYEIPSKYAGEDVTCIEEKAFYKEFEQGKSAPKTNATLPKTIKTVKSNGFYKTGVHFIEDQEFPNLVTVASKGFQESLFESISIGENLESLGYSAFSESSLAKISFQTSKLKTLPDSCFYYCPKLEEVALPSSLESIGSFAFARCFNLKEIALPDGLKSIGKSAFAECKSLKSIVVPTSIEGFMSIYAFVYSSSDSVSVPNIYYKGETNDGKFDGMLESHVYLYSEETPKEKGRYWHYVGGKPAVYE